MFPGSGRPTYSNHAPPDVPPPSNFGPPGYPPQGGYGYPPGPPPQQFSTPYERQDSPHNGGGYSRPSNPPPQIQSGSRGYFQAPSGPPPTEPQSFGQNTGAQFQYSDCTGDRKALLVGINYMGTSNELRGCINDVKNMANFLVSRWGYKWENMVVLTDDQREMTRRPYKQNIYRAMEWLVKDAKPNDSLVFHYSGHGGVTKDLDGDEESGYDDVIYPVDFEQAGHIVDDEMHEIMVRRLPPGCRLTALYDSCHSGTALDLPYVYSTKGVVKEPNMLKDAGQGALTAFMQYESGNLFGAMSSIGGLIKKASGLGADRNQVIQVKASPADVISISGCKDDQTSADARENGQSTGAMSWSFIKVMNDMPNQSYLSLLNNMRYLLKQKYSQKPQLSTSHPQDMNLAFIM